MSGSAGPNDFVLDVTYRDFSVTHDDFTGYAGKFTTKSNKKYVNLKINHLEYIC